MEKSGYEATVIGIWDCDAGRVFVRIHEHRTDQHGIDSTGWQHIEH